MIYCILNGFPCYSNTTLVKVKYTSTPTGKLMLTNSNTTLVKVKYSVDKFEDYDYKIQIQLLLKLNARKINPYGFYYTIKSINRQGF